METGKGPEREMEKEKDTEWEKAPAPLASAARPSLEGPSSMRCSCPSMARRAYKGALLPSRKAVSSMQAEITRAVG